jgi:hypothetical protein
MAVFIAAPGLPRPVKNVTGDIPMALRYAYGGGDRPVVTLSDSTDNHRS